MQEEIIIYWAGKKEHRDLPDANPVKRMFMFLPKEETLLDGKAIKNIFVF